MSGSADQPTMLDFYVPPEQEAGVYANAASGTMERYEALWGEIIPPEPREQGDDKE